jgi:hypothetical protein
MKKPPRKRSRTAPPPRRTTADELRPEYDFSAGVRGKYAARYRAGTNVVLLEPDVAARFPDAASVNRALRAVAELADEVPPKRKSGQRSA